VNFENFGNTTSNRIFRLVKLLADRVLGVRNTRARKRREKSVQLASTENAKAHAKRFSIPAFIFSTFKEFRGFLVLGVSGFYENEMHFNCKGAVKNFFNVNPRSLPTDRNEAVDLI